jgi:RNA polymerase sigma-70 factor (ECF subfamily)
MAHREATSEVSVGTARLQSFSDPGFVARMQAGDRDAMAAVVRAYLPQIHRAARGAGLAADRADDVVQETFKTFVESAARFEGRSHVRTWLFGILYRKIAEARRGLGRERELDDIDQVFESRFDEHGGWSRPPHPADGRLSAKEARRQISECLEAAPARQRFAFVLREVEGFETPEICRILDVSRTNLGVMLHRLRNRVRECLEAKGVTGAA